MKNLIVSLTLVFITLSFTQINAQKNVFEKGTFNLSAGYGLVPTFVADGGAVNVPPISARLGYAVNEHLNVSSYLGYSASTSKPVIIGDGILSEYQNKFLMVGLRGEAHSNRSERFDVYGGFMLGYSQPFVTERSLGDGAEIVRPENGSSPHKTAEGKVIYSAFVGTTYFLKHNVGIFAEAGYGVSLLNIGFTFKM